MITASDLLRVSLRQVTRQRSYGVIFSIALGITAFISLAVLGQEIRQKIGQDMVLMGGVNVIQAYMNDGQYPGQPHREFFPDTIKALRELPGVDCVSLNLRDLRYFPLRVGERTIQTDFIAVDQFFWITYAASLQAGRVLDAADIQEHRRVCVIGNELARILYGNAENALDQLIFLDQDIFKIVGVVSGVMLGSWRMSGFLPYTTVVDRGWMGGKVNRLFIRANTWENVATLVKQIPETIRTYQQAPYLVIRTQEEQLDRIRNTFSFVQALLWLGIGASLMLGGFGIWTGTFSAVRARTREVGLKKAMGGSDADIMGQFLMEALCKAVAGGILGVALGTLAVELGCFIMNCHLSYAQLLLSSLGSILFSAAIGVAGGIYPAIQASRMDVVTALRFE